SPLIPYTTLFRSRVRLRGCRVSGPSPRVFDRRRPHGSRPAATAPHPPALNPAPRSPGTAPPRGAGRPAVRRHLVGLGTAVTSAGRPVTGAGGGERCTGRPAVGHPGRPLACPAVSGGGDVSGGSADPPGRPPPGHAWGGRRAGLRDRPCGPPPPASPGTPPNRCVPKPRSRT